MSRHISEITSKAHQCANCILRSFTSGDESLLIREFMVHVRPIDEYHSIIWSPHSKHDIDSVEKVQKWFTKCLSSLKHLSYDERLAKLGIPTLELHRLHLDLIFCYKVIFGLVSVSFDDFFALSAVPTMRGHKYKLYKSQCIRGVTIMRYMNLHFTYLLTYLQCSRSLRLMFFIERIISLWNSLPPTINFTFLATFKHTIGCVDFSMFLRYS